MNERKLAETIARDIFESGDELPNDKTQRISFKGGKYPDAETDIGGFCESALADRIHASLIAERDEKGQTQ